MGRAKAMMAGAGLAAMLAGCTSATFEHLPSDIGGLPADAPAPPATAYQYPAVHDMPPPRSDTPLTAEQQIQAEKELVAVRDRQEDRLGEKTTKKTGSAMRKRKKKPVAAPNASETAGAKTNP
jgi:hypothetical protein